MVGGALLCAIAWTLGEYLDYDDEAALSLADLLLGLVKKREAMIIQTDWTAACFLQAIFKIRTRRMRPYFATSGLAEFDRDYRQVLGKITDDDLNVTSSYLAQIQVTCLGMELKFQEMDDHDDDLRPISDRVRGRVAVIDLETPYSKEFLNPDGGGSGGGGDENGSSIKEEKIYSIYKD